MGEICNIKSTNVTDLLCFNFITLSNGVSCVARVWLPAVTYPQCVLMAEAWV